MKRARIFGFLILGLGLIIWGLGCGGGDGGGGGGGDGMSSPPSQVSSLEGDWLCTAEWVDCYLAHNCVQTGDTIRITIDFSGTKPYIHCTSPGGGSCSWTGEYEYAISLDELGFPSPNDSDREIPVMYPVNENNAKLIDVYYYFTDPPTWETGKSQKFNCQRTGGSSAGEGLKILNGYWSCSVEVWEAFPYEPAPNEPFQLSVDYTTNTPIVTISGQSPHAWDPAIFRHTNYTNAREIVSFAPVSQDLCKFYSVYFYYTESDQDGQSIRGSCIRQ